jgi:hypothetical protein
MCRWNSFLLAMRSPGHTAICTNHLHSDVYPSSNNLLPESVQLTYIRVKLTNNNDHHRTGAILRCEPLAFLGNHLPVFPVWHVARPGLPQGPYLTTSAQHTREHMTAPATSLHSCGEDRMAAVILPLKPTYLNILTSVLSAKWIYGLNMILKRSTDHLKQR